jgi:hypothetical protein
MSRPDRFDDDGRDRDAPLQGQVLRRSRRREAVLFLRNDALWVADFVDGRGEVIDAVTWVRFNCGAASSVQAQRRMVFEAALPLDDDLAARIDALQGSRPPERGIE